jgi:hypothetical protein
MGGKVELVPTGLLIASACTGFALLFAATFLLDMATFLLFRLLVFLACKSVAVSN